MAKKRIRILVPYQAAALGVEAVAGDVKSVDAFVADQLLASRAAELVKTQTKTKAKRTTAKRTTRSAKRKSVSRKAT